MIISSIEYIDTKNDTYVGLDGIIREDGGEAEKNGRIYVSNPYVLSSDTLGRLKEQMKARDMIFYIRALTTIILAEHFRHFRLGSIIEKISDNFIRYLLSIITTVLLKLYSFISQPLYFLCVTDSLLTTITSNYCCYY